MLRVNFNLFCLDFWTSEMVANKNVDLKSQPDCVNSNQDRLGLKCISKQQTSAIASEVRVRVSANKRITALLLAAPALELPYFMAAAICIHHTCSIGLITQCRTKFFPPFTFLSGATNCQAISFSY